jgi:hypothetical protein
MIGSLWHRIVTTEHCFPMKPMWRQITEKIAAEEILNSYED